MSDTDNKPTAETALAQMLSAFGHGLGGLRLSHAAAKAGLDRFSPVIQSGLDDWDARLIALMAYATAIGRMTAHHTLSRGGTTVTVRDFLTALKFIEAEGETSLGRCPFFDHHQHP